MKYLFFPIVLFATIGCNSQKKTYHFKLDSINTYDVGKHTIRYSYKYPYLSFITRAVYKKKKVKGYNFEHILTIVELPGFDTVYTLKKVNLEWFEIWKIDKDTIFGFMGDGVPQKGPVWEYFKDIRFVKILPTQGLVYDTLLFKANGQMGGIRHMEIISNKEKDYLMFYYDLRVHLIELPSLRYLGHTQEITLYPKSIYFNKNKLFVSIVDSRLAGHSNDLYIGEVNINNMQIEKMYPIFLDSVRNVYGVVGFSDKNNFIFTAGDGMFAHHIYAFYKKRYRVIFSFPDNTIPFITGGRIEHCNVFAASLGHPSSYYTYKIAFGILNRDSLVSLKELPLKGKADFIYPAKFYKYKNKVILIFDVYNKKQKYDKLYIIEGSCLIQ